MHTTIHAHTHIPVFRRRRRVIIGHQFNELAEKSRKRRREMKYRERREKKNGEESRDGENWGESGGLGVKSP